MSAARTRVLLVDPDPAAIAELDSQLTAEFDVVAGAHSGEAAIRLVEDLAPDVVVLEDLLPGMTSTDTVRELTRRFPTVATVILTSGSDFHRMREAMGAGARDCLPRPFAAPELRDVIRKQARVVFGLRRRQGSVHVPGRGLWVCSSPCGGLGKTTLLLSLAAELAARGGTVLVADFDVAFGAVAFYSGIEPGQVHLGALARREVCLPRTVDEYSHEHAAGFRVLVGPSHSAGGHGIRVTRLVHAAMVAAERYDHVLVDLPPGIPEGFLDLLEAARFLLLPMAGDIGALRKVRMYWKSLVELGLPVGQVYPVMVGEDASSLAVREAGQLLRPLGARDPWVIPPDRQGCEAAALASMPVTLHAPGGLYAQAVRGLVEVLVGEVAEAPRALPAELG